MTSVIETTVETVRERSGDVADVLHQGLGVVGSKLTGLGDWLEPEPEPSSKSWLWILVLALLGLLIAGLVLNRKRAAQNSNEWAGPGRDSSSTTTSSEPARAVS